MSPPLAIGRIHSFESFGTVDGPGIRFVVFFQGCPLRCRYCHNPDTWDPTAGQPFSADAIVEKANRCRTYLHKGGVTLSGGDPLFQPNFALDILHRLHDVRLHSALDTSGALPIDISAPIIDAADMVLLDIKALDSTDAESLTGQPNTNTLATLDYCERTQKRTWIRHVLVPGLTLDTAKLEQLAAFLSVFTCVEKVELLPFHQLGAFKWAALGLPYTLAVTPTPSPEELRAANALFKSRPYRQ